MTGSRTIRSAGWCLVVASMAWLTSTASAADKLELSESASDKRSFQVSIQMELDGQVQAAVGESKAVAMKMTGTAQLAFHERRLSSLGRDAADFRGLRIYDRADFHSQVADRVSDTKLRPEFRQIMAEGQAEGLRLYSPFGPLTYEELELIRPPVDSLTAVALLPADRVEIGETWDAPRWSLQFMTAVEAVEQGELKCTLESVTDEIGHLYRADQRGHPGCLLRNQSHRALPVRPKATLPDPRRTDTNRNPLRRCGHPRSESHRQSHPRPPPR